jgi:hypothetical protein
MLLERLDKSKFQGSDLELNPLILVLQHSDSINYLTANQNRIKWVILQTTAFPSLQCILHLFVGSVETVMWAFIRVQVLTERAMNSTDICVAMPWIADSFLRSGRTYRHILQGRKVVWVVSALTYFTHWFEMIDYSKRLGCVSKAWCYKK